MMVADRRPILLANARIVDPSRDLEIDGDLLIADGVIREAKRGIGAAGVPEGTEVVDCRGKLVAPGLVDMRAFVGEPGAGISRDPRLGEPGGGRRRRHHHRLPARHLAGDRRSGHRRLRLRRARDTAIVHVQPMAALTKGLRGRGDGRDRPAQGRRRRRLHRRRQKRHQCAGHAPRAHLCARLRRADRASHRGPRPDRRRRDERRRIRRAARPDRRADGGRDHHAGARHAARAR